MNLVENGARRSRQQCSRANQILPESVVRRIYGRAKPLELLGYGLVRLRLLSGSLILRATYRAQKRDTKTDGEQGLF